MSDIQIGDILPIRAGQVIAVDGLILDGVGVVDESAITGEPIPVTKRAGDRVFAGTVCVDGFAIGRAARLEILVKGGQYLENIAGATTFCFDKTGTITRGTPAVVEVIACGTLDKPGSGP